MKRAPLLLAFLLAAFSFTAAQTQTRERRSSDSGSAPAGESTAVRSRVVSPVKVSNHSAKQDPVDQRQNEAALNSKPDTSLVQPTAMITEAPSVRLIAPPANTSVRANTSRAMSPARTPAAGPLYRVGAGDVLDIRLVNMPTRESTLFTVLKPGVLEYPLLGGTITVDGLTTDEIAALLSREIKVIDHPRVTVSVRDYASHAVTIMGLVDSPGRKVLRREAIPLYTVLAEALPRPEATMATLVRAGKDQSLSLVDQQAMSTMIMPGDVIKISGNSATATKFVYVGGEVPRIGEREFREGMTLTQVLMAAGGVSRVNQVSAKIARRNAGGFLATSEYNIRAIEEGKAPDPLLQAGDRIEVRRGVW